MSSSFRVRCGACRTKLEVRPEACGLTIPCPTCGKTLSIPATPPEPKPRPEPRPEIPERPAIFARKPSASVTQPESPPAEPEPPPREPSPPADPVPVESAVDINEDVETASAGPWVIEDEEMPVAEVTIEEPEMLIVEPVVEKPEMLIVEPVVEEPEMLVVEPEPVEAEPELPVVQAWQEEPPEDRPPEENALLNMDLSEFGGEPARKRRRRDPDDDLLPSREKKPKKKSQADEEEGPYWLQKRGLSDDDRGGRYEFNSTVIGGICLGFFGLVLTSAGLKFGFLVIWGPIFMLAGIGAIWRGLHGE